MAKRKKKMSVRECDAMLIREANSKKGCEWDWDRIEAWTKQHPSLPVKMFRMWDTWGQTPHSELGKQINSDD
jgi:hypothetical protein